MGKNNILLLLKQSINTVLPALPAIKSHDDNIFLNLSTSLKKNRLNLHNAYILLLLDDVINLIATFEVSAKARADFTKQKQKLEQLLKKILATIDLLVNFSDYLNNLSSQLININENNPDINLLKTLVKQLANYDLVNIKINTNFLANVLNSCILNSEVDFDKVFIEIEKLQSQVHRIFYPLNKNEKFVAYAKMQNAFKNNKTQKPEPKPNLIKPELELDEDFIKEYLAELKDFSEQLETAVFSLKEKPTDKDILNLVFRLTHSIKGNSGIMNHVQIGEIAHKAEDILELARNDELVINEPILDAVINASNWLYTVIQSLSLENKTGNIEESYYIKTFDLLENCLKTSNQPKVTEEKVISEPINTSPSSTTIEPVNNSEFVRISTDKLDSLLDIVGELVISSNLIKQDEVVANKKNIKFAQKVSQLALAISDLQKLSMSMRMIPIGNSFEKLKRVVHDYQKTFDKKIRLEISGNETEIDRHLVNQVYTPLVHMIRNACDHGIETVSARKKLNKPEAGLIKISAYHQGNNIVIEVKDDGKGLDENKIFNKATELGIIEKDSNLTKQQKLLLITKPGLSTAKKVTDISGRGVGMDVVNQMLQKFRAKLEIDSISGKGATFRLVMPLTLAIIEGMLINCGDNCFVIPVMNVERFIQPQKELITDVLNKTPTYKLDDKIYEIKTLGKKLNLDFYEKDFEKSLLIEISALKGKYLLQVDSLLNIEDIVVKSIKGELINNTEYMGSTILGNGKVSLILDVNEL